MAMSLLTVPLLLVLNATAVRVQHVAWLLGLAGVAALTLLLAPQPGAFLVPRFRGLVLWVYSLVCAYALLLELQRWPRERLARLMLGFALALLGGLRTRDRGPAAPVVECVPRYRVSRPARYRSATATWKSPASSGRACSRRSRPTSPNSCC